MKTRYEFEKTQRHPIKRWTRGVHVDNKVLDQLRDIAALPFIHKHVAAMPDVHWGLGATVGSAIATKGAIVPAAVGVDLGCGMNAVQTTLTASDLPDSLIQVRLAIEAAVPHGRTDNGRRNDKGAWSPDQVPAAHLARWHKLQPTYDRLIAKHPKCRSYNNANHIGTLGTGNHFIEICLDEQDRVWVMLHSGSRGVGNRIGMYFIEAAKREMERYFIGDYLPNQDLAYLVEKTELFDDYVAAVSWAQAFAWENRQSMMAAILAVIAKQFPPFEVNDMAVNCHHNYVDREHHFGMNVWVTRKGAVRARQGDLGIIPGSMGTPSFIVRGKGNPDSFCSCSHGAGRVMSRGEARRTISVQAHQLAMTGIEARTDSGVLDESPAAYKNISAVMAAQSDLIDIVHTLRQIVNIKG
ncbi:MAG: RtcB family protein [Cyanobacteria bacterium P01_H01_bin.15]